MSDCPLQYELSDLVTNASATYSLTSNYTGSVTLSNSVWMDGLTAMECVFGFNDIRQRYTFNVQISMEANECTPVFNDCLEGDLLIVDGVISSINKQYSVDAQEATLPFESNFHYLTQKSLNTEPFLNILAEDVWEDVAIIYGGVPAGNLTNNIVAQNYLRGPATSNNLLDELKAIAQAGYAHSFVQVDGKLTADPWWNCADEGNFDYSFSCDVVISANRVIQSSPPPTLIRVRGGFEDLYDCGTVEFTDLRTSEETERAGYESFGGGSMKCVFVGINQKDVEILNNNLAGEKEDLENAELLIQGLSLKDIKDIEDGVFKFTAENTEFFKGDKQVFSTLVGQKRRTKDTDNRKAEVLKDEIVQPYKFMNNFKDFLVGRAPTTGGQAFGSGVAGGIGHNDITFTAKEPSNNQIEVIVYDPALITQWGVLEEQIDNKYIQCKEQLVNLAVARFQQWKMEQNTWEVEIVPLPCLQLNDYVSIELPKTSDCPQTELQGIIAGITYNYESPNTTMKLTIWGTDQLCNSTYYTGNLITNYCGINGEGDWEGSSNNIDNVGNVSNDGLTLITLGNFGYAYVYLNQPCTTPGDSYTITFDAEFLSGVTSGLLFNIPSAGVSVSILATGTYSYNFTATLATTLMKWELFTVGQTNHWRIRNIILTKSTNG